MKTKITILFAILMIMGTILVNADSTTVLKSGTCGDNLTWVLYEDMTLVISGTGDMDEWSSSHDVPWSSYSGSISDRVQKVVIESGCTSIGNYAFNQTYVKEVQLADTIESIIGAI